MGWTIGSASEHGEALGPRGAAPARGALLVLGAAALVAAGTLAPRALPSVLCGVAGAALLLTAIERLRAARPPRDGPAFAIAGLRDGPVEVVGRVVPPKQALLSPLTTTKCSHFAFAIHVLEPGGERRLVEERAKRCDFWLKDVTGSVLVRGEGLDVRMPPQLDEDLRTHDQTPRAVGERLQKLGIEPFVSPGVRRAIFVRETRLDPGDNVLVRGTLFCDADGERVIGPAPGAPFSVERWTRPTFVPRPARGARARAALGLALLVGGAAGALAAAS